MKVIDVAEKHPAFDIPNGLGQSLIAAGTHKLFVPVAHLFKPANTTWWVTRGHQLEDVEFSPEIRFRCDTCNSGIGVMSGPTAQTQKFTHCRIHEDVPQDIQRQYKDMRANWEKRFGSKKGQSSVSGFTPRVVGGVDQYEHFGV